MREASHIFSTKNVGEKQILTFEILTKHFEQSGPGCQETALKAIRIKFFKLTQRQWTICFYYKYILAQKI